MARRRKSESQSFKTIGDLLPYTIKFNEQQKQALKLIQENRIIILSGPAGTGKSLIAVYAAIQAFNQQSIDKIVLT